MKWNVQLSSHDFSTYEFLCGDDRKMICKYNRSQGSLRMKCGDHYGVFLINSEHLTNRKSIIENVYGSEIGTLTRNLWRDNTGHIIFNEPFYKLIYKIDTYLATIEITDGNVNHICNLNAIPHPGREEHFIAILISLAWMQATGITEKLPLTA